MVKEVLIQEPHKLGMYSAVQDCNILNDSHATPPYLPILSYILSTATTTDGLHQL